MNDRLNKWKEAKQKAMTEAKEAVKRIFEKEKSEREVPYKANKWNLDLIASDCDGATAKSAHEYKRVLRLVKGDVDCLTVAIPIIGNLWIVGAVWELNEAWIERCLELDLDYVKLIRERIEECLYDLSIADDDLLGTVIEAQGLVAFFYSMRGDDDPDRASEDTKINELIVELSSKANDAFGRLSEDDKHHWEQWQLAFIGHKTHFRG